MGKTELQGRQRSMAPTKKGKRKKAGKQNRKTAPDDEQHRKTMLEVDTLKQHLVLQRDIARRAMSDSERLKQRLADLEEELERAQGDKKDIYEEMIRQYQHLQRQTETQIQRLETENRNLQEKLAACQEEAQQSRAERAEMLEEKRTTLAEMQHKMDQMETEYEKILHASLDRVVSKLQTAKISWEKEATAIHLEYKDQLKEFGLNPLEF
ncbi:dynein regulatory complex protein 12 isoform X1 [Pogona vitticeps]